MDGSIRRIAPVLVAALLLTVGAAPVPEPPAPEVESFSPTEACVGATVTISGKGFNDVLSVRFNGVSATFTRESNEKLAAQVPAGATSGPISVTTPEGTATSSSNFTVRATGCPSITSFSPTRGPVGTQVSILGTGFNGTTRVEFNGQPAGQFTVNSDSQITALVPNGATTGPIRVTTSSGQALSQTAFTVTIEPRISALNPSSGCYGSSVTINGTDLTGATQVRFSGVSATFKVDSPNTITAVVPTGATTGRVTVTTPNGTATSPGDFTISAGCPTITTFTPASGGVGTVVTISGSNLNNATAVLFNRTSANFTVVSPTQLQATVPSGATTGRITVTNPAGSASSADAFTVNASTGVSIASFNPVTGPVGTQVTIAGSGFSGVTAVRFGSMPTSYTVESQTRIVALVPAGATTDLIYVVTNAGTAVSATAFEVTPPGSPTITSFSPAMGTSGTNVTLTGTGFTGASSVTFNGHAATFVVNSPTQISTMVPTSATTGPIRVANVSGAGRSATSFVVADPSPTVSSFSPTSGPVGTTVVIRGTNLGGTTRVTFNGVSATFRVDSPTQISTIVPSTATSGPIGVVTPSGSATSGSHFTVLVAETVNHPRTVSLTLRRHLVAKGSVSSPAIRCLQRVPVKIQKRRSGAWRTIARPTTDSVGNYRVSIRNRSGLYRARLPVVRLGDSELCVLATSAARRYRR